ncbi:helix-turn-helix domain-containing protein [Halorarius litoreus]|uniref:helix-turn-helix domain-containing protein n=1 Tax=Halorarius litoreus TaxID=2962676 RepID=UPI0020CD0996|nr:helix-turn-helix domain-containing protein [Halorarius litoreus]
MSLAVEFTLPADALALAPTLSRLPDVSVDVDQNVWHEGPGLQFYVWVTGDSADRFGPVAREDASVQAITHVEQFDSAALFQVWVDPSEECFIRALSSANATVTDASTDGSYWQLAVRFDDRESLSTFQSRCLEWGVSYEVVRLSTLAGPPDDHRDQGLTPKQYEALSVAYSMGYFQHPREATLEDIAECVGISRQALSRRLRRGQQQVFSNTFSDDATSTSS